MKIVHAVFPFLVLLCGCTTPLDEIHVNRWLLPTRPEEITVYTNQSQSFTVSFFERPEEKIISTNQVSGFTISFLRFDKSGNDHKDLKKMKFEAAKRGSNCISIEPDQDPHIFRARLFWTGNLLDGMVKREPTK